MTLSNPHLMDSNSKTIMGFTLPKQPQQPPKIHGSSLPFIVQPQKRNSPIWKPTQKHRAEISTTECSQNHFPSMGKMNITAKNSSTYHSHWMLTKPLPNHGKNEDHCKTVHGECPWAPKTWGRPKHGCMREWEAFLGIYLPHKSKTHFS